MENYSVLMSVYYKENPKYLKQSIQSMLDQTVLTNDFVIVCDGPLAPELDVVIEGFLSSYIDLFQIIRLPENLGIGGAANSGLDFCKNDLIAKMDSDDIAVPLRCERQLLIFERQKDIAILGSHICEFEGEPDNVIATRLVPLDNKDILAYSKRRMPVNNVTVMYRKNAVFDVGGYSSDLRRCEDYDLYTRMLQQGYKAQNIDDVLVYARITKDAYKRRAMWSNLSSFVLVRWKMYRRGFSGLLDFLVPCAGQIILTVVPNKIRGIVYKRILRNSNCVKWSFSKKTSPFSSESFNNKPDTDS